MIQTKDHELYILHDDGAIAVIQTKDHELYILHDDGVIAVIQTKDCCATTWTLGR